MTTRNVNDGSGTNSNNNQEVGMGNETNVANFESITTLLQSELMELHKYQCGSNEHRADLAKDAGLPAYPDAATDLSYKKEPFTKEEEKLWAEASKISDDLADAESDHQWTTANEIAQSIMATIEYSKCDHCGETHSDSDGVYGNTHEMILMSLFELVSFEIMQRHADRKYQMYGKSDLLRRLMELSPEVKTKEVA